MDCRPGHGYEARAVSLQGPDRHALDDDGDGLGCEA